MSLYSRRFQILEMDFIHAGEASLQVKKILQEIGADNELIRRVAIASYEAEINAVVYGRGGFLAIDIREDGFLILVEDQGPGIPDIELAMRPGYSTATPEIREMGFGAGMGLPNMKKNSDRLEIESEQGKGVRVRMYFASDWGRGAP